MIKNIVRLPHYSARKKRISKFVDFREKYLNISKKRFSNATEAINYADCVYDMLIVGSDQIWNPFAPDFDEIYYSASYSKLPTYAYAVSLGTAKASDIKQYREEMLSFSNISVRENASVPILKEVDTQINAKGVLDPTLLPSNDCFKDIAIPPDAEKDYILCYYLGRKNAVDFKKAATELANRFGFDIYFINANYGLTSYGSGMISDCGPEEFLGYIQNARFVCTNSFHAVALSIRFGVPFFTFENPDLKDTRKTDLLKRLDIKDRIITNYDISGVTAYEMGENDFEDRLEAYREESISFLKEAVEHD